MGRPFVHLAANGQKFGLWTVIDDSVFEWKLRCDCGAEQSTRRDHVISGRSKGCISCSHIKHGMEGTKVYNVWAGMKQRCQNSKYHSYANYGGRGITVCERWQKFENFYTDMGDPPQGSSIDRRDNHKGYTPENCHWTTSKVQQNNRRTTRMLEYKGDILPLTVLAERHGVERHTLQHRLKRGWTVEDALEKPVRDMGSK